MRIESIELEWFRGAADSVALDPGSKSIVVYGENGSGKSCFVDAVEHALSGGRIGHLAHEYSGKHQEKAIINTHCPEGKRAEFRIKFKDKSELRVEIQRIGISTSSGAESIAMNSWDLIYAVYKQPRFTPTNGGSPYIMFDNKTVQACWSGPPSDPPEPARKGDNPLDNVFGPSEGSTNNPPRLLFCNNLK